jgi:hypothetical protein
LAPAAARNKIRIIPRFAQDSPEDHDQAIDQRLFSTIRRPRGSFLRNAPCDARYLQTRVDA